MRTIFILLCLALVPGLMLAKSDLKKDFVQGDPGIVSMNSLTFGPEGILFVGDSKNAMVYAIDTKDVGEAATPEQLSLKNVDVQIAAKLGTEANKVVIQDMAVNPLSKHIYLAVHHEDGTPVLMKFEGEELSWVPLDDVSYSKKAIKSVIGADETDRRGRSLRVWAVSDLHYHNGNVMVTGLSNKEFRSTFRSMAFPFEEEQADASLEVYHAAHGQYETFAPIKAFTTAEVNGKAQLIAGYTCTPLVLFPMEEIKAGEHIKGRTVAELGSWNTPLDMIVMEKEGESYLLIANSNRAVMKVKFSDIEAFEGELTKPVEERMGTEGVHFVNMPWVNVLQLEKMDDKTFVALKRDANGELNVISATTRWL